MKKILTLALVLAMAFCGVVSAETYSAYNHGDWLRCTDGEFQGALAITDTNTKHSLSTDMKSGYVCNRGANEVYVDPRDGVAVADNDDGGIRVEPNECRRLDSFQARDIGLIASAGESTTVQLDVCY